MGIRRAGIGLAAWVALGMVAPGAGLAAGPLGLVVPGAAGEAAGSH